MRALGLWVGMFLVLGASPVWAKGKAKAKARSRPDVVSLTFGWPEGFGADVTYAWSRAREGKPTQSMSLSARLTVTTEGQNLRVGYRDWKAAPAGAAPAGGAVPSLEKIATIVDRKGAFVRVEGALSADDSMRIAIATAANGRKDVGVEATKQVAQMLPVIFHQNAERTWQMLVGSWTGVELEIGRGYETEAEGPVPLVPGGKLKTRLRFEAERRLDCPGQPGKRCVELSLRSEPDGQSLAKLVESLGARFGQKGLGSAEDLDAVEEITLVTEPDRLIPYRLEVRKTVGLREDFRASQIDVTTWTYRYPER